MFCLGFLHVFNNSSSFLFSNLFHFLHLKMNKSNKSFHLNHFRGNNADCRHADNTVVKAATACPISYLLPTSLLFNQLQKSFAISRPGLHFCQKLFSEQKEYSNTSPPKKTILSLNSEPLQRKWYHKMCIEHQGKTKT